MQIASSPINSVVSHSIKILISLEFHIARSYFQGFSPARQRLSNTRKTHVKAEAPTVQPVPGVELLQSGPPPPPPEPSQGMDFVLKKLESVPPTNLAAPQTKLPSSDTFKDITESLGNAAEGLNGAGKGLAGAVDSLGNDLSSTAAQAQSAAAGAADALSSAASDALGTAGRITEQSAAQLNNTLDNVQQNVSSLLGGIQSSASEVATQVYSQIDGAASTAISQLPPGVRDTLQSAASAIAEKTAEDPTFAVAAAGVGIGAPILVSLKAAYGGFSGFVTAEKAIKMLQTQNALLVDVRPESARLESGVPELKRGALGKGAAVPAVQLLPSVRRAVRNAKQLAIDILGEEIAGLARVDSSTCIIIMESRGDGFAKQVARATMAAGAGRAFVLSDGFRGWQAAGLAVKKGISYDAGPLAAVADTAEEALEEAATALSKPQIAVGVGAAIAVVAFSAYNYHYVLQMIGLIGLELTLLKKLSEYESPDEFLQDVQGAWGVVGGAANMAALQLSEQSQSLQGGEVSAGSITPSIPLEEATEMDQGEEEYEEDEEEEEQQEPMTEQQTSEL